MLRSTARTTDTQSGLTMSAEIDFAVPESVEIYDTTLRDGSQQEGISLTVDDKLRVAEALDGLGVKYIEGGWPGANPKDIEFFHRAPREIRFGNATLVAFGSTMRPGGDVNSDDTLRNMLDANTEAVCMVAKSWDYHVKEALRTTLDEALRMAEESVRYLVERDRRVFFDAEHFFDGYKNNPQFAMAVLRAAQNGGASTLVLCDTNGGSLPFEVERIVREVKSSFPTQIGVHFHNDSGCATANALTSVGLGATHVQGCINGYGERTGNTDLSVAIPNLTLKMGIETIPREKIAIITSVSRHLAEVINIATDPQKPYVGTSSFTHKAGLHVSAIARRKDAYEHIAPELVGNGTRFVVSEMAGRSTVAIKASELGIDLTKEQIATVLEHLKTLEHQGFHFETADGSMELLLRRATGWNQNFFEVESFRVIDDFRDNSEQLTEATVKLWANGERLIATGEGNGPVNALDGALRRALTPLYSGLNSIHLTDFKVRVLDSSSGTGAKVRVLIDSSDEVGSWTTIGVSPNVIDASWQALVDSIVIGLLRTQQG
ncbi:2-isopropylmalate synthase [Acidithrix ferrooxidans]|uniref:Citramalate synthase n=3 Tax=root TaxID=1 RepID=A0A0D8HK25_9ACTN|nr:2-isopropylmalate synthase [Acidithrix ferrooxidans]